MTRLAVLIAALMLGGPALADCGPAPDACEIEGGSYHIALPAQPEGAPVVVFLHGAGGTGGYSISNADVVAPMLARGYAVIAPDGSRSFGNGGGRVWNFLPGREGRDEADFLRDVLRDAAGRFALDTGAPVLAGFSAGGFMVSYLACARPGDFAAYAPVSGGFWRPQPEHCAGPVQLFQTHGWRDTTVPLEGRALRGGAFVQGDIFAGMALWRQANGCAGDDPSRYSETGPFQRRRWDCAPGSALEFALFPGGHQVPAGWADMMLDWFEALPGE